MRNMELLLLALGLLIIATAPPVAADAPLTLAVSPFTSFAPSRVHIRVRVEPNADNRMLQITVDSEGFYRRSDIQLEGDHARATTQMEIPNLPGGEYEVTAAVIDSGGRERAVARSRAVVISATAGTDHP